MKSDISQFNLLRSCVPVSTVVLWSLEERNTNLDQNSSIYFSGKMPLGH